MNMTRAIPTAFLLALVVTSCTTMQRDTATPSLDCELCRSTMHTGHDGLSMAPCITSTWEFVHSDGAIHGGTWRHQNLLSYHHQSRDWLDYVSQPGRTGFLIVWWDTDRTLRHIVASYRDGKEDGLNSYWYPAGRLKHSSEFRGGDAVAGTGWHETGQKERVYFNEPGAGASTAVLWYPNGQRQHLFAYRETPDSSLQKAWRKQVDWWPDGRKKSETFEEYPNTKDSLPRYHGVQSQWKEDGELIRQETYEHGELITGE